MTFQDELGPGSAAEGEEELDSSKSPDASNGLTSPKVTASSSPMVAARTFCSMSPFCGGRIANGARGARIGLRGADAYQKAAGFPRS